MSQPTSPRPPAGQPLDRGYDRQVRFGRILGLVFCVAGFTTIGFGWNGTARTALVDMQFPYLISGGIAGAALVVLGVGLLLMAQLRAERIRLTEELQRVGSAIGRAIAAAPGVSALSANGRVVAGKSTYHRLDCRLVEGKSDLDLITVEAAKASGLSACRVCNPEQGDSGEVPASPSAEAETSENEARAEKLSPRTENPSSGR